MPARILVFIRSFSPAASVLLALFIPSSRRVRILGDCNLLHGSSPNVRVSQVAVGEHTGKSTLYLSDKLNVDHRTYITKEDPRDAVPIDIVALDDYFKSGQRVDLIKMDIQGYELHALRGATRVLQENPDINLLLEFWPLGLEQAGVHWKELIEMLRGFSMDVTVVRPSGLIPFDARDVRTDIAWYVNLFASRTRGRSTITRIQPIAD